MFRTALRVGSRGLLALGRALYGLEIHGREHLPAHGPLVLVVRLNARISVFAAAFLYATLDEFYGFAGGAFIVNTRPAMWLSERMGMLPTYKGGGLSALPLVEAFKRLRRGKIIFVTASRDLPWDGRLGPIPHGAVWLALRAGAPLVAVAVQGDYDIWPRWASRPRLRGKLVIRVGEPFRVSDAPAGTVTDAMLEEANGRLRAEVEAASAGYLLPPKPVGARA